MDIFKIVTEIKEGKEELKTHIKELSRVYKQKTGRKVCLSCPADLKYMLLTLENIFRRCSFRFKEDRAQYKVTPKDKETLSNENLTDEKALEFLAEDKGRIAVFSIYPKNWETFVVAGKMEDAKKAKEIELAAKAELAAIKEEQEAKKNPKKRTPKKES